MVSFHHTVAKTPVMNINEYVNKGSSYTPRKTGLGFDDGAPLATDSMNKLVYLFHSFIGTFIFYHSIHCCVLI